MSTEQPPRPGTDDPADPAVAVGTVDDGVGVDGVGVDGVGVDGVEPDPETATLVEEDIPAGDTRLPHLTVPDDGLPLHFRRVVSFHPRGGRLNPVQRRAWDTYADRWNVDPTQGLPDLKTLFGRNAPLVIEIGSGMGEATAGMAANRPDVNILAIEVYKPGVAQTFHHLGRAGAENVRLMRGDAIEVLEALIPPASVAEIWLFFPDPWPKARHLKRRLVNPAFATLVASRLKKGGVLRMATDWEPYAEQMLAVCTNEPKLQNRYPGWAPRPEFRPRTRFERRGLTAGRAIFDLEFVRR